MDFEGWYRSTYPQVLAALVVALADGALAEEAAAEGYAKAYERWPSVSTMQSSEGWVFTVGLNSARRTMRTRWRARVSATLERAADTPRRFEIDDEVWQAVRVLPRRQREAVALRYLEDLSQAEVARRMGVAEGTASALLSQARKALRDKLGAAS